MFYSFHKKHTHSIMAIYMIFFIFIAGLIFLMQGTTSYINVSFSHFCQILHMHYTTPLLSFPPPPSPTNNSPTAGSAW